MKSQNRLENWLFASVTAVLIFTFLWIACTQKSPIDVTSSLHEGIPILTAISAIPAQVALGGAQSQIQVKLVDQDGNPLKNEIIIFTTNLGTIITNDTTDTDGWAKTTLTSGQTAGQATIYAVYGKLTSISTVVKIISSFDAQLQIQTARTAILANGIDATDITVKVFGDSANPVSGATVFFATTCGTITSSAITNNNGEGTARLTSIAHERDTTATVMASYGDLSVTVAVTFEGIQLELEITPKYIIANGTSQSSVKAILKRSESKIAIPNGIIRFATDLGTIASEATTNMQGVAQVSLTSGLTIGWAHVVVRYGPKFEVRDSVQFQISLPAYLEASATPPILQADGQSQSTIQARVSDATRNPVPNGTVVVFEMMESGSVTKGMLGSSRILTANGIATNRLTSARSPGTNFILVYVENYATVRDTVEIVYVVGEASNVLVWAEKSEINANGVETDTVWARVQDAYGHLLQGVTVFFSATVGDITQSAITNSNGIATAHFSSSTIGNSTITARVTNPNGISVSGSINIRLLPGSPSSIILSFNPTSMGVKGTGLNQTVTVSADVRDSKNNPVKDGTAVKFSIVNSPTGGEFLSSYSSIPTVNGISRVSFSSDTVSGSARIRADVLDANQTIVVTAISTELIIHGGPPYMEDINDYSTTHLTVVSDRLNIWAWVGSGDVSPPAEVTVLVGDKYNNPVQKGTAVYFTTSGGVITTHTAYTDENGLANVTLYGGNPQPTIDRYYNYSGMQDPNTGENMGDHLTDPWLPDFEVSQVLNTEGDFGENDGIARIMASTVGVDENQDTVRVWDQTAVVLSKSIQHFEVYCADVNDTIPVGGNTAIYFEIWDSNGNPIVPGSKITASIFPQDAQADLTWSSKETLDPGQCYYGVTLINSIDPEKPKFVVIGAYVTIKVESANGTTEASVGPIYLGVP